MCRAARADGRTGMEEITGQTIDISDWLDFEFYDTVWVLNQDLDESGHSG